MWRLLKRRQCLLKSQPEVTGHLLSLKPGQGEAAFATRVIFRFLSCPLSVSEHSGANWRLHSYVLLFNSMCISNIYLQVIPKCPVAIYKVEGGKRDGSRW